MSNTVLLYLEQRGEDVSSLLDVTSMPEEFLKDPSHWMKASQMEAFLEQVVRQNWQTQEENLLQRMAHASPELRSWGVLDSVVRMMPRPQEILAKPSRFLSNFVSPEPPVEKLIREETGLSFEIPISSEQFPLTTQFLKWSFETLPVFVGREHAVCTWEGLRLSIRWESNQKSMFDPNDPGPHSISPELLRQIVASLEEHQHELLQKNSELQARNDQLIKAQQELEEQVRQSLVVDALVPSPTKKMDFLEASSIEVLRQNFSRLTDYWVRSQQLITLLVGQDRLNPSVKEAMRRVDWERVKSQFNKATEESFTILEKSKELSKLVSPINESCPEGAQNDNRPEGAKEQPDV
ncbi:MAG: hypothetical protein ACK5P7_10820 [Bdellovibrio sp.]|jgi:uncharacterized protein YjgD (DUF1641 family)